MDEFDLDLDVERTPSEVRDLLEVRVRRLDATAYSREDIDQALAEIEAIASATLFHRRKRRRD